MEDGCNECILNNNGAILTAKRNHLAGNKNKFGRHGYMWGHHENLSRLEGTINMIYGELSTEEMDRLIPDCCERICDTWLRDTQITVGRDAYYMTGTSRPDNQPPPGGAVISDGLRIWRSENLYDWQPLGVVWSLDMGPAWLRDYRVHWPDGGRCYSPQEYAALSVPVDVPVRRALWAPKIHYSPSRDNFYVVGCMNFNMGLTAERWIGDLFGGCFLLESTTGAAIGPYRVTTDTPLMHYIDPCLFEDDDGSLIVVWQDGNLARLNNRLDGLLEVDRPWQSHFDIEPVKEGACLFKHEGRYHLGFSISAHRQPEGHYSLRHAGHGDRRIPCGYQFVVASAESIHGPYGKRYSALVNGGHGCPFQVRGGEWWACVFHPPGHPEMLHKNGLSGKRTLGPRLVAMRWINGQIVPDDARTRTFYKTASGTCKPA